LKGHWPEPLLYSFHPQSGTLARTGMEKQLFKLPEYHRSLTKFVSIAIHEVMIRKSPILSKIRSIPSQQIPTFRTTGPSGQVVENAPLQVLTPFTVKLDDAKTGNFDSLFDAIDDASEHLLREAMSHFYSYLDRMCAAAGTSIDAKGQPVSHDLILRMLDSIEIDFDQNGEPEMPTLVMHPTMAEQIRRLPPPTEAQLRAFTDLIDRKRQEYGARQRSRRLS
jgi:predicted transcriptional regulator